MGDGARVWTQFHDNSSFGSQHLNKTTNVIFRGELQEMSLKSVRYTDWDSRKSVWCFTIHILQNHSWLQPPFKMTYFAQLHFVKDTRKTPQRYEVKMATAAAVSRGVNGWADMEAGISHIIYLSFNTRSTADIYVSLQTIYQELTGCNGLMSSSFYCYFVTLTVSWDHVVDKADKRRTFLEFRLHSGGKRAVLLLTVNILWL